MRPVPPSQRQVYFSAALTAAAAVLVSPTVHWPASAPSASLDAAVIAKPSRTAEHPVLAAPQPRGTISRPSPSPTRTAPRISDDLESARLMPTATPTPSSRPSQAPSTPAPQPSRTQAAAYPSYSDVPSQSGAYGSPKAYAESLVGAAQFACLEPLWDRESGWNPSAENPSSGAFGIPQALPGSKMAVAGADWATNPATQVRWGIEDYIIPVYGSPCGALAHENADGWY